MPNFVVSREYKYLASKHIHQSWVVYDKTFFKPELFSLYGIQQPSSLNQAVVKRKSEFLAGRIAAQAILSRLKKDHYQIVVGDNRSPVWPQGYIGTISHTGREAICLMASDKDLEIIGVDIENWLTEETAASIEKSIVSEPEVRIVEKLDMPFHHALTIVFSAKESLFKALYPSVGRYFGFEVAQLARLDTENNTFTLALVEPLEGDVCANRRLFTGSFSPRSDSVVTYI